MIARARATWVRSVPSPPIRLTTSPINAAAAIPNAHLAAVLSVKLMRERAVCEEGSWSSRVGSDEGPGEGSFFGSIGSAIVSTLDRLADDTAWPERGRQTRVARRNREGIFMGGRAVCPTAGRVLRGSCDPVGSRGQASTTTEQRYLQEDFAGLTGNWEAGICALRKRHSR